jgi:protocatechuate 3,4-dioxygenase alpha subunit
MITPGLTPSQTVGPFFHDALLRPDAHCQLLVAPGTSGERIRVEGRVLDGDGLGVPDALVELWQANSHGCYVHPADTRGLPLDPAFSGYGRTGSDAEGRFWFETIRPGPVPFDESTLQAPHLSLTIFARGLLNHLFTRLYFADEPANASDPILLRVPAGRRHTLIAERSEQGTAIYRLDIVLQGPGETVFFNFAGSPA